MGNLFKTKDQGKDTIEGESLVPNRSFLWEEETVE